jgi:hypothetical protein
MFGNHNREGPLDFANQFVMKIFPEAASFDVRVHAWKY